jgi:pseudaminic acid biosynthesis-associated methylase
MKYCTPQERFWAGEFGSEYIGRNDGPEVVEAKAAFFRKALSSASTVNSVMEFGCNIGLNLTALSRLIPGLDMHAVEINPTAVAVARERLPKAHIVEGSIFELSCETPCDLAFTSGVMIHLNPDLLPKVYAKLAQASRKFVLIAEYYNPTPVVVKYRGHEDRLFKRDFAGEFLNQQPEFHLVDYGFVYHRDPRFPLDDVTWFLMEK